jgi:hypothetical protein
MIFGVAFTDAALDLQDKTIRAYQKGSISAVTFTKMLTTEDSRRSPGITAYSVPTTNIENKSFLNHRNSKSQAKNKTSSIQSGTHGP